MLGENMSRQDKQIRFGILWKGVAYDIFFIKKGRDESIYVSTYIKTRKQGLLHKPIKGNKINTIIRVEDFQMVPYTSQKISFHPSGLIADTDKGHIRNIDGLRGIRFDKVTGWRMLFTLLPASPEKYRRHPSTKKPLNLIDVASYGFVPPQITCYLVKSRHDFAEYAEDLDRNSKNLYIPLENFLSAHGLDLVIRFHKSSSVSFLPGQLMGCPTSYQTSNLM